MAEFEYFGRDINGNAIRGQRNANSADDLASSLAEENIYLIESQQLGGLKKVLKKPAIFQKKVKNAELQLFCRQMQTLLKAGIPVVIALRRLSETTSDKYFSGILTEVLEHVINGRPLALALEQYPGVFSKLFVNIIKVGENTGRLDVAFLQLSDYLNLDIDTKKKISAAVRYPIMVIVAGLVALFVINILVIPNFAKMFQSLKGELPLPTRMLIASSNFLSNYWYVIIAFVAALLVALKVYMGTTQGRIACHKKMLAIPIIGWLMHRIYLGRFARLFALVLRAGISALQGIDMVAKATGNAYMASKIDDITALIARGNSIASACEETRLFSPLVIQMIMLGEETGSLDNLLDDVADYYEREVAYDLARLSDMIEPVLLIVMAVMVLILALGVFLPMWDMIGLAQGR